MKPNPEVRIERLEPIRVAAALGFGQSPEPIAWKKLLTFARSRGLPVEPGRTRFLGFNNPDPSPGSPNYGYEQWMTVPEGVAGRDEIEIKRFEGGLFAVTRCTGIGNLGTTWKRLAGWVEESRHQATCGQWFEELLSVPDGDAERYEFDLYLPIAEA